MTQLSVQFSGSTINDAQADAVTQKVYTRLLSYHTLDTERM